MKSAAPALVALWGRRRVGKTFLINNFFRARGVYFEVTGRKDGPIEVQLQEFRKRLQEVYFSGSAIGSLDSWGQALALLTSQVRTRAGEKQILFFDELPWLATRRSNLLAELDHHWNSEWSKIPGLVVVLCGSAASWMLDKVVNAKGGLYNRVTTPIHLAPFTLAETERYLEHRGIELPRMQIAELYMALGGVPFYLDGVKRGRSAAQAIQSLFFEEGAPLADEFDRIFPALFANARLHRAVVAALARRHKGIFRKDLLQIERGIAAGSLTNALAELEASGFIKRFVPYGLRSRSPFYRVADELTLFHARWVGKARRGAVALQPDHWLLRSRTAAWHSWAGYAFENLCHKHSSAIVDALGIRGIRCTISAWKFAGDADRGLPGADIDLVIDRADGIIDLCEIKFTQEPLVVSRQHCQELKERAAVFRAALSLPARRPVVPVLISAQGTTPGKHAQEIAAQTLTLDDLFR